MKSIKSSSLILLLLVIAILYPCTACQLSAQTEQTTVKIGLFANITHAQGLLGKEDGTFQEAFGDKVSIDWKVFNAGPAEIEALFAGEIDIGYIGPGPALNGYVKSGGDLKIIAGATDAGAILVSRQGLDIKSVADLQNKKVAVPQFGNTQDIILRYLMKQNNLTDTAKGGNVDVRQAQNADIKTLLGNGSIDAALVPEPWGSLLVADTGAKVVLDYDQVWRNGQYTTALVIVRTEFLQEHPEIVKNFLAAHVELTQRLTDDTTASMQAVNAQIAQLTNKPIGDNVLLSAFQRMTPTYNPEKDSVAEMAVLMAEIGYLDSQADTEKAFDLTILNQVLQEQGLAQIP